MKLFIEINGGNLAECYTDIPNLEVTLIDWDNIDVGGIAGVIPVSSLGQMPPATGKAVESAYNKS